MVSSLSLTVKCRSRAVSRILSAFARQALRHSELRRDDHSSSPVIADGIKRPTRKLRTGRPSARLRPCGLRRSYTPLFGLAPSGVLPAICLTTDAVRSYRTISPLLAYAFRLRRSKPMRPATPKRAKHAKAGGIFSVPLVLQVALTGRYPAHCPSEFGLSSRRAPCGAQQTIILPAATGSV